MPTRRPKIPQNTTLRNALLNAAKVQYQIFLPLAALPRATEQQVRRRQLWSSHPF